MLVQKNLNESIIYVRWYLLLPNTYLTLKSLAILTFHNMKYDILSVISYCTLNESALIFILLGLLSQVNSCMYLLFVLYKVFLPPSSMWKT